MLSPRPPEFRSFVEYLRQNPPRFPLDSRGLWALGSVAAGFLASIGFFVLTILLMALSGRFGFQQALAAGFLTALGGGGLGYFLVRRKTPKLDPAAFAAQRERADKLQSFHNLMNAKQLGVKVDPMVIQLLEAAAVHYLRIRSYAQGPAWKNPEGHRASLKSQILKASDEAMDELLDLGASCIGEPPPRASASQQIVDSMSTLNFADAIGSLRGLVSSDRWVDSAHRSANAPLVFEPMKDVALRLKALADEMEAPSAVQSEAPLQGAQSSLALDSLLAEVRAVREAEEELRQRF